MNFYLANLLTHPSQPQHQNEPALPDHTNSFVGDLREAQRNVNSTAKARTSAIRKKDANIVFTKRKANIIFCQEKPRKLWWVKLTIEGPFQTLIV